MDSHLSARPVKLKVNRNSKVFLDSSGSSVQQIHSISNINESTDDKQNKFDESQDEDVTLPDDAWQDTFDKLLRNRSVLRKEKIIKKDIRASFNMNSSYENSVSKSFAIDATKESNTLNSGNSYFLLLPDRAAGLRKEQLRRHVPNGVRTAFQRRVKGANSISTPLTKAFYPFKCGISPINSGGLVKKSIQNSLLMNSKENTGKPMGVIATPINAKRQKKCVNYAEISNTILKELSSGHRKELMLNLSIPIVESALSISSSVPNKEVTLSTNPSIDCTFQISQGTSKSLFEEKKSENNCHISSTMDNNDVSDDKEETILTEKDDDVLLVEYGSSSENEEHFSTKSQDNYISVSAENFSIEHNVNAVSVRINSDSCEQNDENLSSKNDILSESNVNVTFNNNNNMPEESNHIILIESHRNDNSFFEETGKNLSQNNSNVSLENNNSVLENVVSKKALKRSIRWLIDNQKTENEAEKSGMLNSMNNSDNDSRKTICLKPGKWQKSLNQWRRRNTIAQKNSGRFSGQIDDQSDVENKLSRSILRRKTTNGYGQRKSIYIPNSVDEESRKFSLRLTRSRLSRNNLLNCKDEILKRCRQRKIQPFEKIYDDNFCSNCRKIGEGTYGEVFLYSAEKNSNDLVLKIIPIEGNYLINDEPQKTLDEVLSEVIISTELSSLQAEYSGRKRISSNFTTGFVKVNKVKYIIGKYPLALLKLWKEYDNIKGSENDNPECFETDQQFLVIELSYGGQDLETYLFTNAKQSYFALLQIVATLAVGENAFQFEHRDLHWGNVLLQTTKELQVFYRLNGEEFSVSSDGVQVTIIDYTLSRMMFQNNCYYNDLANDEELFMSTGDYQFDIYRMMRLHLKNKWEDYRPKTNIYWISYIVTKLIDGVNYKKPKTKVHLEYLNKLQDLKETILSYESCIDWVRSCSNYNFH